MTIDLQRGRFLRVMDGVGSTLTTIPARNYSRRGIAAVMGARTPGNTLATRPPHSDPWQSPITL
jgi:hypothetical protein